MHALYMNASIVFISWKVESRIKEANTINNVIKKIINKRCRYNDILNPFNPF